jgi:hypothetical protein
MFYNICGSGQNTHDRKWWNELSLLRAAMDLVQTNLSVQTEKTNFRGGGGVTEDNRVGV